MKQTALLISCFACLAAPAAASAQVEEAQARYVPWSGYWWPLKDGGILQPLQKYDRLTGRKAAAKEQKIYPSGPEAQGWWGYCHAWSASSIMEREPRKMVSPKLSNGSRLELAVGDQKALLAACHTDDAANTYGRRNNGAPEDDPENDLKPDELWRLLKLYVKQQGLPLILDIDSGPAVWNFPVYAYRIELTRDGGSEDFLARMTLWMADDFVAYDFVGTHPRKESLRFRCKIRNGSVVMGSAKWIGDSVAKHPDFAWYPYVARSENDEVEHAAVLKLLAGGSQETPPRVTPYPPDEPTPPVTRPDTPPAAAPAQRVLALSPSELLAVVTNKTSSFNLDITVDKFDGGQYTVGERYLISGSSEKAGYLYLFHIAPPDAKNADKGSSLTLLFPALGQDNRIPAKTRFSIPGGKDQFKFVAEEPLGTHVVKAVVTARPLSLTGVERRQKTNKYGGQSQAFRLPPTEKTQMQQVLRKVQQGKMKPEEVEQWTGVKPRQLLGEFAQDEVPFYVGPKGKEEPRPKEEPKPKPKSKRGD